MCIQVYSMYFIYNTYFTHLLLIYTVIVVIQCPEDMKTETINNKK